LLLALLLGACGAATTPSGADDAEERTALRLRHQIMVRYDDRVEVFEGYMILLGQAFLVRAFAGPGIDLFTVKRDRDRHHEEAHVAGLKERLDLERVGADIARVYLPGCADAIAGQEVACAFYGEELREQYDDQGRLVSRFFPEAHGVGLTVSYADYGLRAGSELAGEIRLSWGESGNEMVIRLLEVEPLPDFDRSALVVNP
jgi:hypothetical protein